MVKSVYLENAHLNTLRNIPFSVLTPFISLHTAWPAKTGANEVAGNGYIRQAATFNPATSGSMTNLAALNFTSMPAVVSPGIIAAGVWDAVASGNFLYAIALTNAAEQPRPFALDDTTADTFKAPAHGYSNNDLVIIIADVGAAVVPSPLVAGTLSYVITVTTDNFQLAATAGGVAINITGKGAGLVQRIIPKIINAGDTTTINSGQLSIQEI